MSELIYSQLIVLCVTVCIFQFIQQLAWRPDPGSEWYSSSCVRLCLSSLDGTNYWISISLPSPCDALSQSRDHRLLRCGEQSAWKRRVTSVSGLSRHFAKGAAETSPGAQPRTTGEGWGFPLSEKQIIKEAKMFQENPRGFRSARWGNDETRRNSEVIARSCHCYAFHAIVMSRSKRNAGPCF